MKLHLPVTLLRAVMALFATSVTFTSAWAESTVVEPLVITLSENAVYEQWDNTLFEKSVEIEEMNRVYADVILTSAENCTNSVSATFKNCGNSAFWADYVTLQNLNVLSFANLDDTAIYGFRSIRILNNNTVGIEDVVCEYASSAIGGTMYNFGAEGNGGVLVEGNGSVSFADNKATVTEGGSAEGAVVRADNVYLRNNGSVSVTGNESYTKDGDCIGGAISAGGGSFDLSYTNGNIDISGNSAVSGSNHRVLGGAILAIDIIKGYDGRISINNNSGEAITIKNNTAKTGAAARTEYGNNATPIYTVAGGALIGMKEVELANNTSSLIEISNNKAIAEGSNDVYGGAIATFGNISIVNNKPSAAAVAEGEIARQGIVFDSNEASSVSGAVYGGAIVSSNDKFAELDPSGNADEVLPNEVKFADNGDIAFTNNSAISGRVNAETSELSGGAGAYGGAIYSGGNVAIGGADGAGESQGNGDVTFAGNSAIAVGASANGGAIVAQGSVKLDNNSSVTFSDNEASSDSQYAKGGAISSTRGGVSISGNGAVTFSGNSAIAQTYADGGAIHVDDTDGKAASVEISNNTGAVTFENNHAIASISSSRGGAICNYATEVIISGNTYGVGAALPAGEEDIQYSLAFTGNIAGSWQNSQVVGGAIYSIGKTSITGNGNILFRDNIVFSAGGDVFGSAIGTDQGGLFIDENSGGLTVEGNKVYAVGTIYDSNGYSYSGASLVSGAVTSMTTLSISGNAGDIVFSGNSIQEESVTLEEGQTPAGSGSDSNTISITAGAAVGAMSDIYLDKNQGNISFIGNTITSSCKAALGGAIASATGDIRISNNNKDKAVVFSGNSVTSTESSAKGGAIGTYAYNPNSESSASVVIAGNGAVTFSGNSAVAGVRDQDGNIVSYHNSACGGAIYSEGDVELSHNGAVSFGGVILDEDGETAGYENGNIVQGEEAHGGAVYSKGDVTLSNNSSVSFYGNALKPKDGDAFGGAIYSAKSVSIENNTNGVNFSGNSITCNEDDDGFGGAIYAGLNSGSSYNYADFGHNVKLSGNGNVTFADNKIVSEFRARGGAIYADGYITLSGNGDVTFSGNSVKSDDGGSAIGGAISTYLMMGDDGKVPNNYATIPVGVTLSENKEITFAGNSATSGRATANGGAIYSAGKVEMTRNSGNILFSGNSNVSLSAYSAAGGALAGFNGVNISDNTGESIRFENNLNKSNGGNAGAGAVYAAYNNVSIIDNKGAIEFDGNRVEGVGRFKVLETDGSITTVDAAVIAGGAIGADSSSVIIKNNGAVSFTDNVVVDNDAAPETTINRNAVDVVAIAPGLNVTGGGAIMSMANTEISGNAGVTISGNSATSDSRTAMGGAIATVGSASISHNNGDVNVSGNYAASETGKAMGGAIASYGEVSISHNKGDVNVSGNYAASKTAMGGAIFTAGGLSIVNNEGNVTFSGNYVKKGDNHQLNSVDVQGVKVELAAVKGKSISFYDSVLVGSGSEVVLNSYSGQTTTGAIVFSGANAVETLQQLKGEGVTVSTQEISASLTSQIIRDVTVAGGSLQVKDGAVLQMVSLGVNKGAELLIGAGSTVGGVNIDITVTFAADSKYTVQGLKAATTMKPDEVASSTPTAAQIAGNVVLTAGMTYTMDGAYTELLGNANELAFKDSGTYTFNVDESVAITEGNTKYFVLFTGVDKLTGAELGLDSTVLTGVDFLTNIGYYDNITLNYIDTNTKEYGGVLYISATVPEPTTATLSLLALAALAARRRRK